MALEPFWCNDDDGNLHQMQWVTTTCRVTKNPNGSTGFARVCKSDILTGEVRVHLCSHSPCTARWDPSKYGVYGEPKHMQPAAAPVVEESAASAELTEPPTLSSAVAEDAEPVILEPEPPEQPESPDAAAMSSAVAEDAEPVSEPTGAALRAHPAALGADMLEPELGLGPTLSSGPHSSGQDSTGPKHRVILNILNLAREIRGARNYVGYSFFVLLAVWKRMRIFSWEGGLRVDILEVFTPWARESGDTFAAVDAIPCIMVPDEEAGHARLEHVSEEHPLHECRHYIAGHRSEALVDHLGGGIRGFYAERGMIVISTVVDGDCGLDVACIMLGLPRTEANRTALRQEVADFLCDRAEEYWLQDVLVATQELDQDLVNESREENPSLSTVVERSIAEPAPPIGSTVVEPIGPDAIEAMSWALKSKDRALAINVCQAVPSWCVKEQLHLFKQKDTAEALVPKPVRAAKLMLNPKLLKHRYVLCERLNDHIAETHGEDWDTIPYGAVGRFLKDRVHWVGGHRHPISNVRRWLRTWRCRSSGDDRQLRGPLVSRVAALQRPGAGKRAITNLRFRKRHAGQNGNHLVKAHIVRHSLFEWFVSLRYNVDWKAASDAPRCHSRGAAHRAIARYTRGLLRAKLRQLHADYAAACLVHGSRGPKIFVPTDAWFKRFEQDYGLVLRSPNRQYKVPQEVQYERLEIMWLNCAKIRKLCTLALGYDPEFENWDQSPFHDNEVGARQCKTLAIVGQNKVPVIESASATHSRWTLNVTTFSDKERIRAGELPYAECMYKYDGQQVRQRIQSYVRSRGYETWLSVTTSPSGSYREHDILDFLERHLPLMTPTRPWRVIMADDYGPHKTDNVKNITWSRGYVQLVHGGGTTPVAQTPDTDLNQHTRREYTDAEANLLIGQMRLGVKVPKLTPEESIDVMHSVLSQSRLHLAAADGYKKTGITVALDGSEDHLIQREAREAWNDRGMRAKINEAIQKVEREHLAGRLKWCRRDVQRLISPYRARESVDKVLQAQGEHASLLAEGDESSGSELEDSGAAVAASDEASASDSDCNSAETCESHESCGAAVAAPDEIAEPAQVAPLEDDGVAAAMLRSSNLMDVYETAMKHLQDCGAIVAATQLEHHITTERRRQRRMQQEDPAVAGAFLRHRELQTLEDAKKRQLVHNANKNRQALADAERKLKAANAALRKRKSDMADAEKLLEAQHSIKNFSLESLGHGKARNGGAVARKVRFQVLDRFARLGTGISQAQRNDWAWFKEAWDEAMSKQHIDNWAAIFASWLQRVLDDMQGGVYNAFSTFVHNETRRCLSKSPVLAVPG